METNQMKTRPFFGPTRDNGFMEFYSYLHEKFTPWQEDLKRQRKLLVQTCQEWAKSFKNIPMTPLMSKGDDTDDWKIDLPAWCRDQRNQMTGPADDKKLVVKMLNSGAPGVMLDLEDSMANKWENLHAGYKNIQGALEGSLRFIKGLQTIEIEKYPAIWIRPRGLHLSQELVFPLSLSNVTTSASLFDVAVVAWNLKHHTIDTRKKSPHPLSFYIPKSETSNEAIWWADLFKEISLNFGWAPDRIKCMALVESHPLAFQMDKFIHNLKDHVVGLNLGRWDYMASLLEYNLTDEDWLLPDRNSIPHDVPFFQNLRKQLVNVCHKRGILAIGGMTALYPSRTDSELNTKALKALEADKKNEAEMGMDGAWTGHPDQNQIAIDQFPFPNQLKKTWPESPDGFNLRVTPPSHPITTDGTRAAIRVAIQYRNGVLNGKGASLLDGYMEDLATDRICRLMIAQRMKHMPDHVRGVVGELFEEELQELIEAKAGDKVTLRKAKVLTENYVVNGIHNPS